jgi:hypothetical protein
LANIGRTTKRIAGLGSKVQAWGQTRRVGVPDKALLNASSGLSYF